MICQQTTGTSSPNTHIRVQIHGRAVLSPLHTLPGQGRRHGPFKLNNHSRGYWLSSEMPSKTSCRKVYVLRRNPETVLQKTEPNQVHPQENVRGWNSKLSPRCCRGSATEAWSWVTVILLHSRAALREDHGHGPDGANRVTSAQQGQRPWADAITPPSAQLNTANFTQLRAQGEGSFATRQQVHFQTIHIKKKKKKKEQESHLIKREHRKLENLQSYISNWNQEFFSPKYQSRKTNEKNILSFNSIFHSKHWWAIEKIHNYFSIQFNFNFSISIQ